MSTPTRRVLVTASALGLDGTAEGSCSVKYLQLLVRTGHEVLLVNGANRLTGSPAPWLPGIEIVDLQGPVESEPRRGPVGAKLGAARAHLTGFGPLDRARRARWRRTLPDLVRSFRPDVVVTRAAGLDATPHLAMVDLGLDVAWVAHLHDPWPLSAFPDPYRRSEGLLSRRQEAACRRILRRADVVAFPAARQRDWQLRHSGVAVPERSVVIPHLGTEGGLVRGLPDPWAVGGSAAGWSPPAPDGRPLRLLHCGSLFRQRDPAPLLDALARVVEAAAPGPSPIHLRLVGWIDPKLTADPGWERRTAPLVAAGALEVQAGNIGYVDSVAELAASDVLLTYVVGTPESPQFPAKLADLFSLGRPMLVIGPRSSTPADLVGVDSPAFVDRDRPGAILDALRGLVARRADGTLGALRPTAEQRALVGPDSVSRAVEAAFRLAVDGRRQGAGGRSTSSAGSGSAPSG